MLTVLLLAGSLALISSAQVQQPSQPQVLSLAQVETLATANQPRLLAAQLRARASAERIRQARAGYLPTVGFSATGVRIADVGTSLAAGFLTTSAVSDRFAYGGSLSQLVTDFGRTSALVGSARFSAQAQADMATLTRAQVRLNAREAFYQVLGAEAVLEAAKQRRQTGISSRNSWLLSLRGNCDPRWM